VVRSLALVTRMPVASSEPVGAGSSRKNNGSPMVGQFRG
jgi:hypothetical protein